MKVNYHSRTHLSPMTEYKPGLIDGMVNIAVAHLSKMYFIHC